MAKLQFRTISNRMVAALKVGKDTGFWDRELTGFGVRVYPSGARVYVAQTRGPGGPKRVTVGRHGVISADQARRRAALIIARVKAGEEPIPAPMAPRTGPTVEGSRERSRSGWQGCRSSRIPTISNACAVRAWRKSKAS